METKKLGRIGLVVVCIFLITANVFVWTSLVQAGEKNLVIKVYSVGQGDSIFIRTPDNYKILVDGGPNNSVVDYLNKDLELNDRSLDLLVLTHPQADHMFGLIETIKKYKVKKIITSDVGNKTALYKLWIDTLKNNHLNLEFVYAGESITLSDQVKLKIVWPEDPKPLVADLNAASVVIKLSYGNFDMLLTGDADIPVQPYNSTIGHVEVLKVPHHGSKTGLREDFAEELSPDVSVISVGVKNRYGHPNLASLELLNKTSKKVLRTDQNGTVTFVSNGQTWYTRTDN